MKFQRLFRNLAASIILPLMAFPAIAADYPAPVESDWVARDFKFHTGEVMPELRLHYTTIGAPTGQPVLVLHGTTGSGKGMLTPDFAGELFGPGQPLDASKYFHHSSGCDRRWKVVEALRRDAHKLSEI